MISWFQAFAFKGSTCNRYAPAEYIKDMKERMRRRAVQANIDAAMAATKQAEDSERMLHATYRAQAAPKKRVGGTM